MNIKDKITASYDRFCPPHYMPHKLPFGKKIADENCHFHKAGWRMAHHEFFCQQLKCPHYESMKEAHKKHFDIK